MQKIISGSVILVEKPNKKKRRYVSDYTDQMDMCNASSVSDCTGLIPSLPRSEDELEAYEMVYDFMPPYVNYK